MKELLTQYPILRYLISGAVGFFFGVAWNNWDRGWQYKGEKKGEK